MEDYVINVCPLLMMYYKNYKVNYNEKELLSELHKFSLVICFLA